ncbi:hypothetical protein [Breoghania sp.]|uniref:hypothetical protein n=1 Tax=Breoghania sp. TaxID=2065378 RepID=UPI002613F030|nr:hypothetical protein [Breoghania sp.]MDJ0932589.1 hypothetical protein [Breoghania sp.]
MTKITERRDAIRAAGGNVVLLDGGDQFQGSLFYAHYKGKAAAELMNRIGYDAMVVGNHEFDDGPKVPADFIGAIDFPILLANADLSREAALKSATILQIGGERIALIGITAEDTDELSSPGDDVRRRNMLHPRFRLDDGAERLAQLMRIGGKERWHRIGPFANAEFRRTGKKRVGRLRPLQLREIAHRPEIGGPEQHFPRLLPAETEESGNTDKQDDDNGKRGCFHGRNIA